MLRIRTQPLIPKQPRNVSSVFVMLQQIYAERDLLMLDDIERLQEETSVREERYEHAVQHKLWPAWLVIPYPGAMIPDPTLLIPDPTYLVTIP